MNAQSTDASLDTRQRLIEAAILTFAEKGFDGAGIREIAQRAKANSALVTYHFSGKEGLYLECLRFIFARKACRVAELAAAPSPEGPDARAAALQQLKNHIWAFMQDLMACDPADPQDPLGEAAMALMAREMQAPRPVSSALLMEQIRPHVDHLMQCLQVLRPDLSWGELLNMGMSIQGQLLYFRNSLGIARLIRGNPNYPEDLEEVIRHFTDFSLRGLGIPEAFPQPRI
ncbi:TetR family transcriptional regulator [Geothrix oryzae]|uniref:TetR family transcriptional regulator n=1 Tax=Geothrix oryzae TaxID=2927975 RepID=A0ABN6UUY8_9BACT|nr:CerR family C-terminal domain-containing protein [Geothrix oryzae]BDU68574.1 TetR family transcriptional regulator [Geothrix oryzae]